MFDLVACRLVMIGTLAARYHVLDPDNEAITTSEAPAWWALGRLWEQRSTLRREFAAALG